MGRSRQPATFRPDPGARVGHRPTRRQSVVMLVVLLLVAGAAVTASYAVRPNRARAFQLFYGSVFLNDERYPVAVDLTDAKPTVRLANANQQVNATSMATVQVVPLDSGTLLLNTATGEFNMVDPTGFVVKTTGGGVQLPHSSTSTGVADGDSAYIVQTSASGTSVYLVGEPTVQAAERGGKVVPRASATMTQAAASGPGAAVAASGNLWLLVQNGAGETVRELTVPQGSNPGVALSSTDRTTVAGPAALGMASRDADGTGPDVVAVATATGVTVFDPDGTRSRVSLAGVSGVDRILPTTNQTGTLSFLYHTPTGWLFVAVRTDGTGLARAVAMPGIPAGAQLTESAASNGDLYTMDTTGRLFRIGPSGTAGPIAGAASYPVLRQEHASYSGAYTLARGDRVIFNAPNNLLALAVFTDGSRAPTPINKSTAVNLNSAGGEAITRLHDKHTAPAKHAPVKVPQQQVAPVSNAVACKTAHQIPHVPTITSAQPAARSVTLGWNYPLLDPQDCVPSTYVVTTRLLSGDAPSPPGAVTVNGTTGVTLTGLFPSTRYEITVTAYINGAGTNSEPVVITTGPEGPAAPVGLTATANQAGGWTITWNSCGGVQQGCVATTDWTVLPSFCDGVGLSAAPAALDVPGDPTAHTFSTQLPATDALLGRGLSFRVQGTGETGTPGTVSKATPCTYSWATPNTARMSLQASAPPIAAAASATTSTTLTLNLGADAVRNTGGVGAQFTYQLLNNGTVVRSSGPSTSTTATFTGLMPGVQYAAQALVSPPHQPAVVGTVGPVPVLRAQANWPTIGASASFADDGDARGTLTVAVSGISSASARGETFDLVNSQLTCGNTAFPLRRTGFDPAVPLRFSNIDRSTYNGSCSVQVQLAQDSASALSPPLYGPGGSSNQASSGSFTIDVPTLPDVTGQFSAAWDGSQAGLSQVAVKYTGSNPLMALATNWTVSVTDPDGDTCGGYSNAATLGDVSVQQSCVAADGASGDNWGVSVSFSFFGTVRGPYHAAGISGGAAPTYIPPVCVVTPSTVVPVWDASTAQPQVDITADPTQTKNCSGWTFALIDPSQPTANCGTATGPPPQQIAVAAACLPDLSPGWQVTVNYKDTSGNPQTITLNVTGSPPPPPSTPTPTASTGSTPDGLPGDGSGDG